MKVILNQDVKDLGKAGQLVNVSEGYARNFLFPKKLAIAADAGAMKNLVSKQKAIEAQADKLLAGAKAIANKINNCKVVIHAKVGQGTRLYGSVTSQEIADALNAQHKVVVDKRKISISEPIKTVGTFEVPVKLHHDVSTNIHVEVVGQE